MDPNAPWKDSENATNAPSFRLWVHLRCNLGAGRVHLYQTRSQHFGVHAHKFPIRLRANVFGVVTDLRLIAGRLFLAVGRNAGIGRHAPLAGIVNPALLRP